MRHTVRSEASMVDVLDPEIAHALARCRHLRISFLSMRHFFGQTGEDIRTARRGDGIYLRGRTWWLRLQGQRKRHPGRAVSPGASRR
jgi:hypothetical protein